MGVAQEAFYSVTIQPLSAGKDSSMRSVPMPERSSAKNVSIKYDANTGSLPKETVVTPGARFE
jgi:hypothetical protein